MKFLSVCSGIEAASVAWNPLGWEAVAFSEIEPFPCAVLKQHYPDVPNFGDMTEIFPFDTERADEGARWKLPAVDDLSGAFNIGEIGLDATPFESPRWFARLLSKVRS